MEVDMVGNGPTEPNGIEPQLLPPPPPLLDHNQPMLPHNGMYGVNNHVATYPTSHQHEQQQQFQTPPQQLQPPQQPWIRPPAGIRPPRDRQVPPEPAPAANFLPEMQQQAQGQPMASNHTPHPQGPDQHYDFQSQQQQQQQQQLPYSHVRGAPTDSAGDLGSAGLAAGMQQMPVGPPQSTQGPSPGVDDNGWIRPAKRASIQPAQPQPYPQHAPVPLMAIGRAASGQVPAHHQAADAPPCSPHAATHLPQGRLGMQMQANDDGWIRPGPKRNLHAAQPAASTQDAPVSSLHRHGSHEVPQHPPRVPEAGSPSRASLASSGPGGHEVQQQQGGHSAADTSEDGWIRPPEKGNKPGPVPEPERPETIMVSGTTWSPEYEGNGWAGAAQDLMHQHLLEEYSWKDAIEVSARPVPVAPDKLPATAPSHAHSARPSQSAQQQPGGQTASGQAPAGLAKAAAKAEDDGWIRPPNRRPPVAADQPPAQSHSAAPKLEPAGRSASMHSSNPGQHADDGWMRPRRTAVQPQGTNDGNAESSQQQIKQEPAVSPPQQMSPRAAAPQPSSSIAQPSNSSDGWIRPPRKPNHEGMRTPTASSLQPSPPAAIHAAGQGAPSHAARTRKSQPPSEPQPVSFALPYQERLAGPSDASVQSAFLPPHDPDPPRDVVPEGKPAGTPSHPGPAPVADASEGWIRPQPRAGAPHQPDAAGTPSAMNLHKQRHAPARRTFSEAPAGNRLGQDVQHHPQDDHGPTQGPASSERLSSEVSTTRNSQGPPAGPQAASSAPIAPAPGPEVRFRHLQRDPMVPCALSQLSRSSLNPEHLHQQVFLLCLLTYMLAHPCMIPISRSIMGPSIVTLGRMQPQRSTTSILFITSLS